MKCNKSIYLTTNDYNNKLEYRNIMNAHEIDYEIYGEEMQYVEIELDPTGSCCGRSRQFYDDGFRY